MGQRERVETSIGVLLDFRNPPRWPCPPDEFAQQQLALASLADRLGIACLWVTEHHFADDGYCPSPAVALGALAACTSQARLGSWVQLLGLRHPVHVAEDFAFLDNLSGGRVLIGVGAGYRPEEFAGLGVDRTRLGSLMDEKLEILLRCLASDAPFSFSGEHFRLQDVLVTPRPVQPGGIEVYVGSTTATADRRAIRLGAQLAVRPGGDRLRAAQDACLASGRSPDSLRYATFAYVHIADTAEEGWTRVGPFLLYGKGVVQDWFSGTGLDMFGPDLRRGCLVGPPDEVAAGLARIIERYPGAVPSHLVLHLLHPGLPYQERVRQVERLSQEVLPLLAERLAQ
jgi:alkanesulfonate monooxygenase SsuD/methylene tetrahydromethanopterin reductase-like flavin-dependent oxidoreductase (luciferase family)